VEVAMQATDGVQGSIHAFANNINTREGGTHMTGFKTALTRVVNDYATSHGLLKDIDGTLKGEDIREGLTAVISLKHPDPQFEGQTKTKLGNSEVRGIVESAVHEHLSAYLEEHPDTAEALISKAVEAAKARMAAKKAEELTRRKSALATTSLPGKLADCQTRDPTEAELFVVEGDSAGGCFTGDTEIALASGRSITLERLVEERTEGKTHYCYTIKEDGRIGLGEIETPRKTRENAELVAVTLDNGQTIRCTPDHEFMLRDGSYCEARELASGRRLMPLYRRLSDTDEEDITIDGYEMVKQPSMNDFWEFTHLLADKYNIRKAKYSEADSGHKHHKDFDESKQCLRLRHRPETETPLKNKQAAERSIAVGDRYCQVISDYLDHQSHEIRDKHGRRPLISSKQGRLSAGAIRNAVYALTRPCQYGQCPHDRDPDTCEAMSYQVARDCPSSRSPHGIRRGSITKRLRDGTPQDVVSDRSNVSREVLDKHYDQRSEDEKMEQRRRFLEDT